MQEWWQNLRADVAIFGVCGGMLAFAIKPTRKIGQGFLSVFAGLIVAVTGTPYIDHYWQIPSQSMFAGVAFILGLTALTLIRAVTNAKTVYRFASDFIQWCASRGNP